MKGRRVARLAFAAILLGSGLSGALAAEAPRSCTALTTDIAAARAAGQIDKAIGAYKDAQAPAAQCEAKALFCLGRSVALAHVEAAYAAASRGDAGEAARLFQAGRAFGAPWPLLVGLGDAATATARAGHDPKTWSEASLAYQQALAALDDTALCPDEPPRPDKAALAALSARLDLATLLARPLRLYQDRCAPCGLAFLAHGEPEATRVLPITFADGTAALTDEGRDTARSLANCAHALGWTRLSVSVHADARGSDDLNHRLTAARADTLRRALQADGFSGDLAAESAGRSRPLPIDTPSDLTAAEIERANRRVELRPGAMPALCTGSPGQAMP